MNYFVFNSINILYAEKTHDINVKEQLDYWIDSRQQLIDKWNTESNNSITLFQYLKEHIHDNI